MINPKNSEVLTLEVQGSFYLDNLTITKGLNRGGGRGGRLRNCEGSVEGGGGGLNIWPPWQWEGGGGNNQFNLDNKYRWILFIQILFLKELRNSANICLNWEFFIILRVFFIILRVFFIILRVFFIILRVFFHIESFFYHIERLFIILRVFYHIESCR